MTTKRVEKFVPLMLAMRPEHVTTFRGAIVHRLIGDRMWTMTARDGRSGPAFQLRLQAEHFARGVTKLADWSKIPTDIQASDKWMQRFRKRHMRAVRRLYRASLKVTP